MSYLIKHILVSITETTELLLSSSVPGVEADGAKVGAGNQRGEPRRPRWLDNEKNKIEDDALDTNPSAEAVKKQQKKKREAPNSCSKINFHNRVAGVGSVVQLRAISSFFSLLLV